MHLQILGHDPQSLRLAPKKATVFTVAFFPKNDI
jgi:hypothetical protein